jgi:hypothetical protein
MAVCGGETRERPGRVYGKSYRELESTPSASSHEKSSIFSGLKFALSPARVSTHGYARGYSLTNLNASCGHRAR